MKGGLMNMNPAFPERRSPSPTMPRPARPVGMSPTRTEEGD